MRKMKRGFYITDEAFLDFQAMAEDEGQTSGPFMEWLIRDAASRRLTPERRALLKKQAEQLDASPAEVTE